MSTEDEKMAAVRNIRLSIARMMQSEGQIIGITSLFEELCLASCALGVAADMSAPEAYRTFTDKWMIVSEDLTDERQFDGEVCEATQAATWTRTVGDA